MNNIEDEIRGFHRRREYIEQMQKEQLLAWGMTYGKNINPEVVPDMLRVLKDFCEYFELDDPDFTAYRKAKALIELADK